MDPDKARRRYESEARTRARTAALDTADALCNVECLLRGLHEAGTPFSLTELETMLTYQNRIEQGVAHLVRFIEWSLKAWVLPSSPSQPDTGDTAKYRNRCKGLNSKGRPCRAPALRGVGFCRAHQSQAELGSLAEMTDLIARLSASLPGGEGGRSEP